MPNDTIARVTELRDWLLNRFEPETVKFADAIDQLLARCAEMEKERQKPLHEMSVVELSTLRGQIDSFIYRKVCGDPRIGISFPTAAPQPKGPDDE